ncbi:hypothetical protein SDC9_178082 [bioreactor metagenome]|uniref:Uncharacterized protein n=1 Tax=bioreactor metagenome TaxID=1076179 RepID=A0A645GUS2_9ZZZZ
MQAAAIDGSQAQWCRPQRVDPFAISKEIAGIFQRFGQAQHGALVQAGLLGQLRECEAAVLIGEGR